MFLTKKDVDKILFIPLSINHFLMTCDVIFPNFWTIMSFSQKVIFKRLMRITFSKRIFWNQITIEDNYLPNTFWLSDLIKTAKTFQNNYFWPNNYYYQTPQCTFHTSFWSIYHNQRLSKRVEDQIHIQDGNAWKRAILIGSPHNEDAFIATD